MKMDEIRESLVGKVIRIETKTKHSETCQRLKVVTIDAIPHDKENLVINKGTYDEWVTDRNILEGLSQGWDGEDAYYDGGKSVVFYLEEQQ